MALPVTGEWTDLVIKLGDGQPTETFSPSCLLRTEKGVVITTSTSEVMIVDCADDAAAVWMLRNGVSLSATVSGTGLMDFAEFDDWQTWQLSMGEKNLQIEYALSAANNGGYYEGPFICETFETNAARTDNGGRIMSTVNLVSAGPLEWVPAV